MKCSGFTVIIYGALVLIGGIVGFVTAQSIPSLVMGSIFGIASIICGVGMIKNCRISLYLASALVTILTIFFGYRFFSSGNFMPSGLMGLLSAITLCVLGVEWFRTCCYGKCHSSEKSCCDKEIDNK